ncbi:NADPH-dependent F420 reductase [Paraburkholderia fungorum]|uniref:NADPH-dependent F420 reductase n=1 Tax=Paraburkholderia fungorum TaxID=134537 RepID=UPI0038B85050
MTQRSAAFFPDSPDSSPFTRSIVMSTIGIIGAGAIGSAFAKALAGKGLKAIIANSRGPDSLADLARELGPSITPGTREQAAAQDIVLVAVNWSKLPSALAGLPAFGGRIVIDANNPIEAPRFEPAELHGRTSSETVADLVPGARVVKAFNHLPAHLISDDPQAEGGHRVLFLAGDDAQAKSAVSELIGQLGFFGIDLGSLEGGGRLVQIPGGPLPVLNLVKLG